MEPIDPLPAWLIRTFRCHRQRTGAGNTYVPCLVSDKTTTTPLQCGRRPNLFTVQPRSPLLSAVWLDCGGSPKTAVERNNAGRSSAPAYPSLSSEPTTVTGSQKLPMTPPQLAGDSNG